MRLMSLALAGAFAVCAITAADAAPPKKRVARAQPSSGSTVFYSRDENGRARTKIIVQKRSYLDGGTEVMPGDNIDAYRSSFMMNRPSGITTNTAFDRPGWWSDPFFLPGKRNPYPWGQD